MLKVGGSKQGEDRERDEPCRGQIPGIGRPSDPQGGVHQRVMGVDDLAGDEHGHIEREWQPDHGAATR